MLGSLRRAGAARRQHEVALARLFDGILHFGADFGQRALGDFLLVDAAHQAFADAIPHYRGYLAVHPTDGNEWTGLGIALIATGNAAEAAQAFRQAVGADPSNAQFRVNLARALLDQGETGAALDEAQRAVAAAPNEPAAHDVLARAFAGRGALDAARREFQRALQIDPKYAPAIEGLRQIGGR